MQGGPGPPLRIREIWIDLLVRDPEPWPPFIFMTNRQVRRDGAPGRTALPQPSPTFTLVPFHEMRTWG